MPTRPLPAVLAGIALLCAALTAPAAGPPHEGEAGLVSRVYSVADLVVPIGPIGGGAQEKTLEGRLIRLVQDMVQPGSWACKGGPGCIDYYPLGMALVVNQTPAAQEQVADLLAALRRLQDVEVSVEMRFVTVSQECLDRLGVSVPENGSTPGMAVLDDTQVHMLLEAVQGDQGASVMQAPKMTMFNGQRAVLDLSEQQAFITGVEWVEGPGRKVPVPQTTAVKTGLRVSLLPTVAPDNRVVTLQLAADMGVLAQAKAPVCTGPQCDVLSLQKTFKVADGQTMMLCGWSGQREVRREFSPPVLCKVPYLSQLFRTVGYGKEQTRLLVLVTPRILVRQEEEQLASGPASAGRCEKTPEASEEAQEKTESLSTVCGVKTVVQGKEAGPVRVHGKRIELSYRVEGTESKVRCVQVWYTRDGKEWKRYPAEVKPTGTVPITVKRPGRWGFTLVACGKDGRSVAVPAPGAEPQVWVEVEAVDVPMIRDVKVKTQD